MAQAYVLRARVAHANIRRIDAAAARGMPGVLLVLTGEDVKADGLGDVPCHAPLNNKDGSPRHDTPRPALAVGKVRHLGQPVALVVAETLLQAQDAAEAIEIDYETLPAVTDARAALEKGAPQLFDGIPGNLVFDWDNDTSDFAATDAAFAKAAHVTTLEMVNNRVVANSMEPRNAIGDWDAAAGRPVLYTGTQGSHFVRDPLAEAVLKVPKEKLRVITPPNVGGGFGMKAFVYPEQVLVVWAAEQAQAAGALAVGSLGRLHLGQSGPRSFHPRRTCDGREGQVPRAARFADRQRRRVSLADGPVHSDALDRSRLRPLHDARDRHQREGRVHQHRAGVRLSRRRPAGSVVPDRAPGRCGGARDEHDAGPHPHASISFPKKAIPYTSPTKLVFDSGEFVEIMDAAMEKADWNGFKARRRESQKRGKLRGIGMATYTERCGGGFPETASIEFKGDRVDLVMGNQEYGTGLVTSYKQLVSDRLGIDADRIDVVYGDSDRSPRGLTGGSRALPVGGSALHEASLKIIDKGKQIAANLLEASAADIEFGDGEFRIVGTDRHVDLFDVAKAAQDPAKLPPGMEPGLDMTQVQNPAGATFPNGCHIAEVEIDPDSGITTILRYTIVDDFGDVINPMLLEGQVHGGVVQGIGQALLEETVYDEEGQLLTGTFMDYAMPRADDLPFFSFTTRNVRCKANPLGIKGAGEAGAIGAPPALINAIVDALHHKGVRHIDMPATPSRVWEALHAAG